ncbi:MAG: site-specific integrase [Desulfurellales bacterium]|nr:MAG: site-specific integrase [Desulfurellales bacterium]
MKISVSKTPRGFLVSFRDPASRKRFRRVLAAESASEARRIGHRLWAEAARGVFPQSERPKGTSLREAFEAYLLLESSRKAKASRVLDRQALHLFGKSTGVQTTTELTPLKVSGFLAAATGLGLSPATCNRLGNSLKHFLGWCLDKGWLQTDLRRHVGRAKGPSRECRALMPDQIRLLYANGSANLRLAMRISASMGLRAGEVASLSWKAINFEFQTIQIGGMSHFQTKSGRSRIVPMPEALADELRIRASVSTSPWVFPSKDSSKPIERAVLSRGFARAAVRSGLTDCRYHDLRASCATGLAEAGAGETLIAQTLGHASTAMSRKYVSRLGVEVQRQLIAQQAARSLSWGGIPSNLARVQPESETSSNVGESVAM